MKLLPLLLAFVLLGSTCDNPPSPPPNGEYCSGTYGEITGEVAGRIAAILGGYESSDRRSTIRLEAINQGYCTGTVVDEHTVLTAAHCKGDFGYRIHKTLNFSDPNPILASEDLPHPHYQGSPWFRNDIMLVFTEATLPQPFVAGIYDSSMTNECGELVAQGWGRTESGTPSRLMEVDQFNVHEEYETTLNTKGAEDNQAICFGDSGGPLWAEVNGEYFQAGVTSTTWSSDCKTAGPVASTHTKVSFYKQWIDANKRGS